MATWLASWLCVQVCSVASATELMLSAMVAVLPDCSLPGHPEVFAIGDMARLNDLRYCRYDN